MNAEARFTGDFPAPAPIFCLTTGCCSVAADGSSLLGTTTSPESGLRGRKCGIVMEDRVGRS
jgi:hypothetical protein